MFNFDKTTRALLILTFGAGVAAWLSMSPLVRALWIWTALAFGFVALAFTLDRPAAFGKRKNGSLHSISLVLLAPYHLLNAISLVLLWWHNRHDLKCEVAPNLWVGARLPERAAKPDFVAVLDLAAELSELREMRGGNYRSHPTLDTRSPHELSELADWINHQRKKGAVYVHCAAGRGRSATVVCVALLRSGEAASADEARKLVRSKHVVETNRVQMAALAALEDELQEQK